MWVRGGSLGGGVSGGGAVAVLGGGVVGGGGRPMWIPYCSTVDQRCAAAALEFAGKADCLKFIRELNRETSSYRHLAVGLGGSGDCDQLREELKRSRRRAQDLAREAKNKLSPYLQEGDTVRPEVARLWRILFCCIRVLEQEMLRTLTLQHTFGLHLGPIGLINTGVHEYGSNHRSAPPGDNNDLSLSDRLALERAEVNQLHKELIDLRNLINVMESSLDMKAWIMDELTEKQLLAAISDDSNSCQDNNDSVCSEAESVGEESVNTVRRRRCLCWMVTGVVVAFLACTLLGILMAFLT
ncbi:regulator of G-protein signaling 9-binding protein [Procambarus clarkii]|uniref:regulator of G-protein signaling 9-binding protein n=1 Tax=Procambarus clarkii TaxID=6728 RepID=UPI003742BA11